MISNEEAQRCDRVLSNISVKTYPFAMLEMHGTCTFKVPAFDCGVFHYILSGSGRFKMGEKVIDLTPGTILFVPPCKSHTFIAECEKSAYGEPKLVPTELALGEDFSGADDEAIGCVKILCAKVTVGLEGTNDVINLIKEVYQLNAAENPSLAAISNWMIQELKVDRIGRAAMVSNVMGQLVVELFRERLAVGDRSISWITALSDESIWKPLRMMIDNLNHHHSLQDLADTAGMSQSTFMRRFTSVCGETPTVFVRRMRLAKAAQLLLSGQKTIKEAAYSVGFTSRSAFYDGFRSHYGCTPMEYVEAYGSSA